jgi:hypothetical protein
MLKISWQKDYYVDTIFFLAQYFMLLIQGFLKDLQLADEKANFKAYYLTFAYEKNKLEPVQLEREALLINSKLENKGEGKFFLSKDVPDLLKNEPISLNIIKNIKDIAGYKDELSSEKTRTEIIKDTFNTTLNSNDSLVINRIEVSDRGEFILQIPESESISEDLKLKVYSSDGALLQEFAYAYHYLKTIAETKAILELPIKSPIMAYARRTFTEVNHKDYFIEGEILAVIGTQIPEGLTLIFWASPKELKQFNSKELDPIAVLKTSLNGTFKTKLSSVNNYKTVYVSLSADKLLAKKIELDANGLIPSKLKIVFKNPIFSTHSKLMVDNYVAEEFFFYKALRTTQFGLEDQMNSSDFMKPVSCFDRTANLEIKKIAHGHVLAIKQLWRLPENDVADSAFAQKLVEACFDEKFANYFIGGDGLTSNVDLRPPNNFEKALNDVLKYSFHYLEEKMKRQSSEARLERNYREYTSLTVEQSLYDARECLFIPFALEEFDAEMILAFKDILVEYLLEKEYEFLLKSFKFYNDENCDFDADNLIKHLNENLEYYHQVIWYKMSANKRFSLLDNCIAPNTNGKSIASVVENRVIGILGNSIIMPLAPGYSLDPNFKQYASGLMELYKNVEKSSKFQLRIPKLF